MKELCDNLRRPLLPQSKDMQRVSASSASFMNMVGGPLVRTKTRHYGGIEEQRIKALPSLNKRSGHFTSKVVEDYQKMTAKLLDGTAELPTKVTHGRSAA